MRACRQRLGFSGILVLLSTMACGDPDAEMQSDARAAQQDASARDGGGVWNDGSTDAGSFPPNDGPVPTCSEQIGSCPAHPIAKWKVLLDAADFGAGARLIALGGQAVLVALGDGSFRVALIDQNYDGLPTTTYSSWSFPRGDRAPIAISDGANRAGDRLLFVLACDQNGANCEVSRAEVSRGAISTWQNTDLPVGFLARGLVFDAEFEREAICAYGNGLACFRDGWEEAIAAEPGLQLNDVFFGAPWSVAVGEHGRWFKREFDGSGASSAWLEQPTLNASLVHVSVAGAGAVVVGEGKLQAALGDQAQYFACAPAGLLAVTLVSSDGLGYAVSQSGEVLQHPPPRLGAAEPFCSYDRLPAGTVLDVSVSYCLDSDNTRVLFDNLVFGENLCVLVF